MNIMLLYFEFFKTGLFAIGGGLATIPFLFEMAKKYDWLDNQMIGNFLAMAQSAPGAIGVNMAAQTGFASNGIFGAYAASLALVSPAIFVICLTAKILTKVKDNRTASSVFSGLRPAAAGLLAAAGIGALKIALINSDFNVWYKALRLKECIIFSVIFFAIYKFKLHPVIYIVIGAVLGIIFKLV
jgi:chromate transporter